MTRPEGVEWDYGQRCELAVRNFYLARGWYVVPTHAIEDGGAPRLIGAIRSHVLPDLQIARRGVARWVEVKQKTFAPFYAIAQQHRHGVDLWKWNAYREVERETGIPGWFAVVQLKRAADGPLDPLLLVASWVDLARIVQVREGEPDGWDMAFFDVNAFEWFEKFAVDLANLPDITPKVVHPWDRPLGPRQPYLDLGGEEAAS